MHFQNPSKFLFMTLVDQVPKPYQLCLCVCVILSISVVTPRLKNNKTVHALTRVVTQQQSLLGAMARLVTRPRNRLADYFNNCQESLKIPWTVL